MWCVLLVTGNGTIYISRSTKNGSAVENNTNICHSNYHKNTQPK